MLGRRDSQLKATSDGDVKWSESQLLRGALGPMDKVRIATKDAIVTATISAVTCEESVTSFTLDCRVAKEISLPYPIGAKAGPIILSVVGKQPPPLSPLPVFEMKRPSSPEKPSDEKPSKKKKVDEAAIKSAIEKHLSAPLCSKTIEKYDPKGKTLEDPLQTSVVLTPQILSKKVLFALLEEHKCNDADEDGSSCEESEDEEDDEAEETEDEEEPEGEEDEETEEEGEEEEK